MSGTSIQQLAFEFGMSENGIRFLADRCGLTKRTKLRPAPADLQDVLNKLGIDGARTHFQTGWLTLKRWMTELGLGKPERKQVRREEPPLVIPDDWATVAPTKYKFQLAQHYRVGSLQINRIIEATGIRSRATTHELAASRPPSEPKARKPRQPRRRGGGIVTMEFFRSGNSTLPQQAANYLRRTHCNIHRCDILMREFDRTTWGDLHGVPDHGVGYYFVDGKGIISEEQLVYYAEKSGFCRSSH